MAILYCGGESEDFAVTGSVVPSSTAASFRSAYARLSLAVPAPHTTNYLQAAFAATSQVGVTWRNYTAGNSALQANLPMVQLLSGGAPRLRVRPTTSIATTTTTTLNIDKFDGTTSTVLATSAGVIATLVGYRYDLMVDYAATGRVRLWVDGVLFIDWSGDVLAGGGATLDGLRLSAPSVTVSGSSNYFSEIIVTNGEDPRPLSLKTLNPNGAGDVSEWTGDYTTIDETTASDADTASSAVAGQILTTESTGMPAGGSGEAIRAVKIVASALRGAAGPQKLAIGVKSGATYGWSADLALDAGYTSVSHTLTADPATGQPFLREAITALKFALKSVA